MSVTGEAFSVEGFIGKPVIARSNRNFENYYINGRYIKSNIISKAIEEAYRPFMMQHKYPFTMLHFKIEPEFLDVNVHPTKMELRFQNGENVFRMVRDTLAEALRHKELIPKVELVEEERARKSVPEKRIPIPEPFEQNRLRKDSAGLFDTRRNMADSIADHIVLRETPEEYRMKTRPGEQPALKATSQIRSERSGLLRTEQPMEKMQRVEEMQQPSGYRVNEALTALLKQEPGRTESAGEPEASQMQEAPASEPEASQMQEAKVSEPEAKQMQEPPAGEPAVQLDLFEEKLLEPRSRSRHKLIGQLFATYWLVEFKDQLYIIDQHAAHEKVLYEKTMNSLKTREYTCQQIHPPIILTLGSRETLMLEKNMQIFTDIGFEIEPFGGKEYAVRGVPDNLFTIAKKELLMEMLDSLSEDTQARNADMIYEKAASMSCKAAVKGHDVLSAAEADALIDQLLGLENPYACPHGRPTIIAMSKYELEKKFKRIV